MRLFWVNSLLLISLVFAPAANAQPEFETKAPYALGIDFNTLRMVYMKNIEERMAPSSMTKLMTLHILFKKILDGEISVYDEFTVSEKAWRKGGSKMFVEVGKKVKVEDLIRGIIVQSGNDACIVVAEAIAGTEEAFAELMNERAKELGLTNTNFVNSTGWPDENHYMSTRDLGILAYRMALDFGSLYDYFAETEFTYNGITQKNRNTLLSEVEIDGMKTGHTEDGGYGIVLSGKKYGITAKRRVIVVVNGLESDKERREESYKLFRHVMDKYDQYIFFSPGDILEQQIPVWFGEKESVAVYANEFISQTISKAGIKDDLKVHLLYEGPVEAPILKGDQIAYVHIGREGEISRVFKLYALEDIPRLSGLDAFFAKVKYFFSGGD